MKKRVSFSVCLVSVILAAVLAFFAAYSITTNQYKEKIASYVGENEPSGSSTKDPVLAATDKLSTIAALISSYSYYEVTEEDLCYSLIEGFAYYKKDIFSCYYDEEDLELLNESNAGETQGIGVTVIEDKENNAIKVISVVKGSPAQSAGIKVGDRIVRVVGSDGNWIDLTTYAYDAALKLVQGKAGTTVTLAVARGNDMSEIVEYTMLREPFTSESVMYHVSDVQKDGKKIGVVRITGFDLTTPPQFREAMDALIAGGCEYFVFDVRYNPGGDLASITAVLSLMLNKDDTVIITKDRAGNTQTTKVGVVNYSAAGGYSSCNITEEDIGKYRDAVKGKCAVLVNGCTASAAELFTCSLMDYEIAEIVGTTTYGKGSMQSILPLTYYGYTGALKITTKKYFPPISEGYDGVGITPDVTVELDEALEDKNFYDISDAEDNQFAAAVSAIK